jgi:hypothetical protein
MKLKSIVFLGILSVSGSLLFSQNDNEKSIEEIYLQNPELMVIREQVLSDDLQTELQALEGIDGLIKGGTVNNEIENLLISLGESGSASKKYLGRTLVNNFPEVRRKACTILGQIGTDKAREALITILLSESDDTVRAEAAYALGIIGRDEKGDATGAIAWVIDKEDPVSPDNNFAYAATLAFEKIAEKNHGLKNSAGYAALIKIAQGNYIRTVKDKALEVIKGMKKYSR